MSATVPLYSHAMEVGSGVINTMHHHPVYSKTVMLGCDHGSVVEHCPQTGYTEHVWQYDHPVKSLFTYSKGYVAGLKSKEIWIHPSSYSPSLFQRYDAHDGKPRSLHKIVPLDYRDGQFRLAPLYGKCFDVWNITTKVLENSFQPLNFSWVRDVKVLSDGSFVLLAGPFMKRWSWDPYGVFREHFICKGKEPTIFYRKGETDLAVCQPLHCESNEYAVGSCSGRVYHVDVNRQTVVWDRIFHTKKVTEIVPLSPRRFATASNDMTVRIWDTVSEQEVGVIHTNTFAGDRGIKILLSIACLAENQIVATPSSTRDGGSGYVKVYDIRCVAS